MTAIENTTYTKACYINAFQKYNIVKETGKSIEELGVISDSLIEYLKGKGADELLTKHFNEREILHMRDVQNLFNYARMVKYSTMLLAIMILIYLSAKGYKNQIGKTLFFGLFANHITLIALALIVSTNFNKYFTLFHHIFFTNDLWLLDPKTDLMIQMLPEAFFSGMALKILLSFIMYLSIIQLIAFKYHSLLYYMMKGRVKWRFGTKI